MKIFLMVHLAIISMYWGCTHFEVARERDREGKSFWTILAAGCVFFVLGGTVFATVLVSKIWPLL